MFQELLKPLVLHNLNAVAALQMESDCPCSSKKQGPLDVSAFPLVCRDHNTEQSSSPIFVSILIVRWHSNSNFLVVIGSMMTKTGLALVVH